MVGLKSLLGFLFLFSFVYLSARMVTGECLSVSFSSLPLSSTGITGAQAMPGIVTGCWDLNSGPRGYTTSALTYQAISLAPYFFLSKKHFVKSDLISMLD